MKNLLSIAGTDPTGGAGIQTDLKTFEAHGEYGMAVIAAVVAQNTFHVTGMQAMPAELVGKQIECVFEDIRPDAVKIGMLYDAESGEHWFSPAHDVHVLEGVAAGDAFNAGLVHALINDFDPQDAVNYAIAASILKLTIKGDSNLVTADEIAAVASAADGGTRVAR